MKFVFTCLIASFCFYTNINATYQAKSSKVTISSLKIIPDTDDEYEDGIMQVYATVLNKGRATQEKFTIDYALECYAPYSHTPKTILAGDTQDEISSLAKGENVLKQHNVNISDLKCWCAEFPWRYRVKARLLNSENQEIDSKVVDLGFQKICVRNVPPYYDDNDHGGLFFTVNGSAERLYAVCENAPTDSTKILPYLFRLKEAHVNTIFLQNNDLLESWLKKCDFYGIYVVIKLDASAPVSNDFLLACHHHPSAIAYELQNLQVNPTRSRDLVSNIKKMSRLNVIIAPRTFTDIHEEGLVCDLRTSVLPNTDELRQLISAIQPSQVARNQYNKLSSIESYPFWFKWNKEAAYSMDTLKQVSRIIKNCHRFAGMEVLVSDLPHQWTSVKELYQPLQLDCINAEKGDFVVFNISNFKSLESVRVVWQLLQNNQMVGTGEILIPKIDILNRSIFRLPYDATKLTDRKNLKLSIQFFLPENREWISDTKPYATFVLDNLFK